MRNRTSGRRTPVNVWHVNLVLFEPPMNVPILAHIHAPKTAGSSFRRVLDEYYRQGHIHLYFDNSTTFVYENRELAELVRDPSIKAFSSHFVRRFPPVLADRPVYYVTFLRNPIQQFISYITYTRKHYRGIPDRVLPTSTYRLRCPPEYSGSAPNGFSMDRTASFRNFRENYATNFYARYPLFDAHGFDYAERRYRNERLKAAQNVLSNFLLVGIAEHLDESWRLLRHRAEQIGIQLPDVRIPTENVTADQRDSLDWIRADDEVGGKLLESVREDLLLYSWGLDQFRRSAELLEDSVTSAKRCG